MQPQKTLPCTYICRIMYRSSKLVHRCGLSTSQKIKQKFWKISKHILKTNMSHVCPDHPCCHSSLLREWSTAASVDLRVYFGSVPAGTNLCSYWFGLGTAAVGSFDLYNTVLRNNSATPMFVQYADMKLLASAVYRCSLLEDKTFTFTRNHRLEPRCDFDLWPPTSNQVISRG